MSIAAGVTGKCPHCRISNRFENVYSNFGRTESIYIHGDEGNKLLQICRCTNCGELIINFEDKIIYPTGTNRDFAPTQVPIEIGQDFNEACLIESLSPKGSASLARRCLQSILHDKGIIKANLSLEIDEAMKNLPSYLNEAIDSIRNIGNFAAHPMKSTNTGEIIEVEDGEVQWILDVLELLFDFYYVQPAITKAKKDALNAKLQSVSKPPIK